MSRTVSCPIDSINFLGRILSMSEISVDFAALVLIQVAFSKGLIDKKTYEIIMKKYGGAYNDKVHE